MSVIWMRIMLLTYVGVVLYEMTAKKGEYMSLVSMAFVGHYLIWYVQEVFAITMAFLHFIMFGFFCYVYLYKCIRQYQQWKLRKNRKGKRNMILAFKGFHPDLSCTAGGNQFQYQLDVWNELPEESANCVQNGFHCALDPLDCLSYYPKWKKSVYYAVLADGDIDEDGTDTKVSCTRMKLIKPLSLLEFVRCALLYRMDHSRITDRHFPEESFECNGNGFQIVRGKHPMASANDVGQVLGFIHENEEHGIDCVEAIYIDGKTFLPGIKYDMESIQKMKHHLK